MACPGRISVSPAITRTCSPCAGVPGSRAGGSPEALPARLVPAPRNPSRHVDLRPAAGAGTRASISCACGRGRCGSCRTTTASSAASMARCRRTASRCTGGSTPPKSSAPRAETRPSFRTPPRFRGPRRAVTGEAEAVESRRVPDPLGAGGPDGGASRRVGGSARRQALFRRGYQAVSLSLLEDRALYVFERLSPRATSSRASRTDCNNWCETVPRPTFHRRSLLQDFTCCRLIDRRQRMMHSPANFSVGRGAPRGAAGRRTR